jgi:gentisate 1,2-dioxygenase
MRAVYFTPSATKSYAVSTNPVTYAPTPAAVQIFNPATGTFTSNSIQTTMDMTAGVKYFAIVAVARNTPSFIYAGQGTLKIL